MARRSLKAGALTAPLPPVMVTVGDMENSNIITICLTGILSTHPARTYISVRPQRHSYKFLKETGEFVINLTTADQARIVDYVGIFTGAKIDKFSACSLTKLPSENVKAPTIAECPLALECRIIEIIPMGTHDVFIADIVSVSADESVIDGDGRLRFDRAGLMAYAHGEYFALGESLGKFGFSASREGRKKPVLEKKPAKGTEKPLKEKGEKKPRPTAKAVGAGKTPASGRSHEGESAGADGGHRPFYLDAPRKRGKVSTRPRRGGKK